MSSLTLRRLRLNQHIRELSADIHIDYKSMIQPLFVVEGIDEKESIPGIPGTYRDTIETVIEQIRADINAGITKFILFGVGEARACKDFNHGFTAKAIETIKKEFGNEIWLAVDICLCASTEHGHCGILNDCGDHVMNDPSIEALADEALTFAKAGADCVAPSDMMDGRVGAIREKLDAHGFQKVVLMSYSAKFASKFYGPFRIACDSSPDKGVQLKDRKTYQADVFNHKNALACVERDIQEGADIVMVKPAIHYLDIIREISETTTTPVACYYVSGEHALVEAAAEKGLIEAKDGHIESWAALSRAGADIIITYAARYAKEWLSS